MTGLTLQRTGAAKSFRNDLLKDYKRNKYMYLMVLPVLAYYIIFHYWPMYGVTIAFKDYRLGIGILESDWVGFKYFIQFFNSVNFSRVVKNTLVLNACSLLFVFPIPVILALALNEVKRLSARRVYQTFTYLPYFVSTMILCGIITDFFSQDGLLMNLARTLGYDSNVSLLLKAEYFRPIYISSDIWQWTGWNSILYLSALGSINPELYESAWIDGAGRWRKMWHITLSGLAPTIIIMLILQLGNIMNVGFDKVFLLYQPATYSTADVISTFVYRKGLNEGFFGYSTAVGVFNSLVNFAMLLISNNLSKRFSGSSLF